MNDKKIITTPISDEMIENLNIGDVIYLTGTIATCRDDGHKRLAEEGIRPDFNLKNMGIIHAGPIIKTLPGGGWEVVSIGPTTSSRMEKFESSFIKESGIKMIIGKGGMGTDTAKACKEYKAIHCVYPGGCAVTAASQVESVTGVEWEDFGMPEAFWIMKVKEFGPLIVSIDTKGKNLFEENKSLYNSRKDTELKRIAEEL